METPTPQVLQGPICGDTRRTLVDEFPQVGNLLQLPDCTTRTHRSTEAGWEDFPWASPRPGNATHPRPGSGGGAATPRGRRETWPRARQPGGQGWRRKAILKDPPALTQPPRRAPFSLEHVRGQRPPSPRGPRAQRRPARTLGAWPGRRRPPGVALLRRGRGTAARPRGLESEESAAAARAASASASRAPARREQNKPEARRQRRPKPTGRLTRRRETSVRQHGAVSDRGAPRLARGAAARPHRGARLRTGAPGSAATARRKGEAAAAATTAGLGRPGRALGAGSGEGPEDERGAREMGAKVLFLGLKNGGNRVLFSNLASGGAVVAPPPPPGSPLPRPARSRPRPPKPPGARGGSSPPPQRPTAPSSLHGLCPRPGRRQPRGPTGGVPAPPEPLPRPARGARSPGGPSPG